MSRIEKALARAAELRRSQDSGPQPVHAEEKITSPVAPLVKTREALPESPPFEPGDLIIDPDKVEKHLVCIHEPHSAAAEQYRKLRTRIITETAGDFKNTIMVTSAEVGEGKTMTAINLAVALAREIDYTVLLVDADLRNPTVTRYLGIDAEKGLADYLLGTAELPELLIKTGIGKLVVLPAGKTPANPAELLSSERMKTLVDEMKERYRDRYIIFDSSPVLMTADPLALGRYVDGILFVVQADHTLPKSATQALSLLKDFNIFGVVFNNVPPHLSYSLSPSYYRYYGNGKKGQ